MEEGPLGFQGHEHGTQLLWVGRGPLWYSTGTTKFQSRFILGVASAARDSGGFSLRDKGRAVDPSSRPGNTGELPVGPSGPPFWRHCPLSSVDQESRGRAVPLPTAGPPGGSATSSPWDPQPLLGRTPGPCVYISMSTGRMLPVLCSLTHSSLSLAGSTFRSSWSTGSTVCKGWRKRTQLEAEVESGAYPLSYATHTLAPDTAAPLEHCGVPGRPV